MSLINVDFSGLSEPGSKLIEKVSDAIGVLYEPRRIKRKAEAEAEAKKIALLSDIELNDIEQRGLQRMIKQEARKQENIENITMQAAKQMKKEDNVSEIEDDWLVHFFKECENISDKEMQYIWAQILSGEAKKKGMYSKRTINLLSSLDKSDADLITTLGQFIWQANEPVPVLIDLEIDCIKRSGLTFSKLIHLDSIGIITVGSGYTLNYNGALGNIRYFDKMINLDFSKTKNLKTNSIQIGQALLTSTGMELIKICGAKPNYSFFEHCISFWESNDNVNIQKIEQYFQTRF